MGDEVDNVNQVEDAEAARAGLVILAHLIARVYVAHAQELGNLERDDTGISNSSIKQVDNDDEP